jgi:DNA-binding transcriptional regulator YhcF (GntR family)
VCTRIDPNRHGCTTGDLAVSVLDNGSPVPLHEQLSTLLREQIAMGRLTGRVPSILSLAQEHGVSHRTAARALTTLRDEGLIISVRGKGYYVR